MTANSRKFTQRGAHSQLASRAMEASSWRVPSRLSATTLAVWGLCAMVSAPAAQAALLGEAVANAVAANREKTLTKTNDTSVVIGTPTTNGPQQLVYETGLNAWPKTPAGAAATFAAAERISGHPNREVVLDGMAEIRKSGTIIQADKLRYDQETDVASANGNVRINREGVSFAGPEATLRVEAGEGSMTKPSYAVRQTGGHGQADNIEFVSRDQMTIQNATYSTCTPENMDWYLQANRLDLDNDRKVGVGYGGALYFYDVPILASPIFSFPLSGERRSGVLTPYLEQSTAFGASLTVPYYFNLAPNRDLTVFPRVLTRRGFQLGGEFRYMGASYNGTARGEYLPNDQIAGRDRWSFALKHTQDVLPGLKVYWNLNKVSDALYPDELGRSLVTPTYAASRQYLQEFGLTYAQGPWSGIARVQQYQTLPVAEQISTNEPYARKPQVNLKFTKPDIYGFEFNSELDATRFVRGSTDGGERIFSHTQLSYPLQAPGYFVIPKIGLHASYYNLDVNPTGEGTSRFSRTLPTYSLDSGLVFERDAKELSRLLGRSVKQTLEPRLFYAYTPFKDQSMLPLFDTAAMDLSMATIFTANPFSGNDRISDNNKLTAGLTTRLIDSASGMERLRLTLAQRVDFTGQRTSDNTSTVASDKLYSDLLAAGSSQVVPGLFIDGGAQYNPYISRLMRANAGVSWRPESRKVLNVMWRYRREESLNDTNALAQLDLSGQWPITSRLYGIARYNYDFRTKQPVDVLAGLEYDADCWTARLVLQRYANAGTGNASTTQAYVQLDLKGLSQFGTNALDLLRLNIPGYQPVTSQPVNAQTMIESAPAANTK